MNRKYATLLLLLAPLVSAHEASPAPTTFQNGQALTAQQLNDTFAHTHNTVAAMVSGGIVDANIAADAAIGTTKLAAVDFIPKGYLRMTGACTGGGTAGDPCTMNVSKGSFLAASGYGVKKSGTAGRWQIHSSSPRYLNNPIVTASSQSSSVTCNPVDFASTNPQFYIECRTLSTGVLTDALFTVVMW